MRTIGVLALQGAVREHLDMLARLPGIKGVPIKTPGELQLIDALILPGGESTAIGRLMNGFRLLEPLKRLIMSGLPVWGTCAGMILLAKEIESQPAAYLPCMEICVKRNAYGSQLDSFQTEVSLPEVSASPIPLTFIRAPYITKIGQKAAPLLTLKGKIVAARQNRMLATSFHPELTNDLSFHRYFLEQIVKNPA